MRDPTEAGDRVARHGVPADAVDVDNNLVERKFETGGSSPKNRCSIASEWRAGTTRTFLHRKSRFMAVMDATR